MSILSWGKPIFNVKKGDPLVSMPIRPGVPVEQGDAEGASVYLPIIDISTDSEWHSDGTWLSTSFAVNAVGASRCFHFITRRLPSEVHDVWIDRGASMGDEVYLWNLDKPPMSMLEVVIAAVKCEFPWVERTKKANLLMFYSPKDLEYALGWERVKKLYEKPKWGIDQKRNIRGSFWCKGIEVTIKDLKGWSQGSLENFSKSVGHDSGDKGAMNEYKSRMRDGFIQEPAIAFDYARNDVVILHHVQDKFEKQIKANARKTLRIPPALWSEVKGTTGSLTANIFQEWLHTQFWSALGWSGFDNACMKLGRLDASSKGYEKNLETVNQDPSLLEAKDFEFLAYSQCSVGYLSRFAASGDSTAFNCLVQGGRCNNERPSEYWLDDGADIDLNSCYGTALRDFIYPIGLPTLWGFQSEQLRPTLGEFLGEHEGELEGGLWTITVSGSLTFAQDLIFSKIVELSKIASASGGGVDKEFGDSDRDDDLAHIPGDFALIRKEIVNGIITHDILNAIKAVATNQELSQLMKLRVVCAAAYRKSDQCEASEWAALVIEDDGKLENEGGNSANRVDTRTRAWCGVPIEGFVGKLVEERKALKMQVRSAEGEKRSRLDAQQNGLKLLINTLYGTLASPYFSIGNTVIANNITARARLGTWMLNKALHTRQSITDGGIYTPNEVPCLTPSAKKPGFEVLSDNLKWVDDRRSRILKPLREDWKSQDLDAIALEHVNEIECTIESIELI
jgi:DNA polymerase family B